MQLQDELAQHRKRPSAKPAAAQIAPQGQGIAFYQLARQMPQSQSAAAASEASVCFKWAVCGKEKQGASSVRPDCA